MKVEYGKERIYLIPENEEDERMLRIVVPYAGEVFCWFTFDAGKEGNESALVITHKIKEFSR